MFFLGTNLVWKGLDFSTDSQLQKSFLSKKLFLKISNLILLIIILILSL